MRKRTLYSRSTAADVRATAEHTASSGDRSPHTAPADSSAATAPPATAHWRRYLACHVRVLYVAAGAAAAVSLVALHAWLAPAPRALTQHDIDAAVLHTLEKAPPPSFAAKAAAAIAPSVVAVRGYVTEKGKTEPTPRSIGTGVVIVDNGTILTNVHVVAGAERITVLFFDGTESEARIIGMRPEHDLAVIKASTLPDDLLPATMRSTADLAVGDEVVAVGFPFGIGPSATAGIVSGLRREHRTPEGQRVLTNLIQFDAAANPGNSGGPLVTRNGELVGIVTAIFNPTDQRVFVGIGFAVPIENAAAAVGIPPF